MNQNFGTTGIKHAVALLLMMALEDETHQHQNIDFITQTLKPKGTAAGSEAKWMRDLMPCVDPIIWDQIRKLVGGSVAVSGGVVDRQLFEDTAKNLNMILHGLSESYHKDYATTADDGMTLWDPACYPHPSCWRMREAIGSLLA